MVLPAPDAAKAGLPIVGPVVAPVVAVVEAGVVEPTLAGACEPGVPRHLEPYAAEVDEWRRQALAAREARRSSAGP